MVANIGVGGSLLQVLMDYLSNRKQFVRINNPCSGVRDVTSGVPLLFCIFINDLSDALKFSDPFIFADDLKILEIGKDHWTIQEDLDSIATIKQDGAGTGQMCSHNISRENAKFLILGIHIKDDLSWSKHIEERLRNANKVLYILRRNVSVQVKPLMKLGLYKSLILPVLLYGFTCINPSGSELLHRTT
ncbi:uncharacterized protein LOC142341389 [Convolutriloba macropyga]|uniref:uncharacterized protein LOC142341389 n=1 Tax=Convolutriloba macropyga TaxID=536237 RepID=UPI003F51D41C